MSKLTLKVAEVKDRYFNQKDCVGKQARQKKPGSLAAGMPRFAGNFWSHRNSFDLTGNSLLIIIQDAEVSRDFYFFLISQGILDKQNLDCQETGMLEVSWKVPTTVTSSSRTD